MQQLDFQTAWAWLHAAGTALQIGKRGISMPPRTKSSPKHGKETTEKHVGNQWAGGTGGSDTKSLGGRGVVHIDSVGHKAITSSKR
jgi:hypothetical protein